MQVRISFFLKEAILFSLAMAVGIYVSYQYSRFVPDTIVVQPIQFSTQNVLLIVVSFLIFSYVLSRFHSLASMLFRVFLMLVVFSGSQVFFSTFIRSPIDLYAALVFVTLFLIVRTAITHNAAIILGIAGISGLLGLSLTPLLGVLILTILSFYDIIAVYRTGHMVQLARNMVQSKAIFGFLIPIETKDFFRSTSDGQVRDRFMILGSGDIGLPIMFASTLVSTSLTGAILVGFFALGGLFVTHLLFINQRQRHAMAALPPIATACILGFLISLVVA